MGETAVKYLIEEIENDSLSYKTIELRTSLIVRESTFKA
jgi:DNA-binding LacI/PurR family transcriptional regulator